MNSVAIFSSGEMIGQIEKACGRRFPDTGDADECFTCVMDRIRGKNDDQLSAYEGRATWKTFLIAVVNKVAVDCHREKFGRIRPPKAVKDIGSAGEAVWRLICLKKYRYEDAYEILIIKGEIDDCPENYASLSDAVEKSPCPEHAEFTPMSNEQGDNTGKLRDLNEKDPLEKLLRKLDRKRRTRAFAIIEEETEKLSEEDRMLVRLVYYSRQSVSAAAAARVVGIQPAAARKRLKKILLQYRQKLLAEGIRES